MAEADAVSQCRESLPGYTSTAALTPPVLNERKNVDPPAVVALPPIWPDWSASEYLDQQNGRATHYLAANCGLLIVQALLLDNAAPNGKASQIVERCSSFSAILLLGVGTVSAVTALTQYSHLRFVPYWMRSRHRAYEDVVGGILDKSHSTDPLSRSKLVGCRRLLWLTDFCLASGSLLLATSVVARLAHDQSVVVQAVAVSIFGVVMLLFLVWHGAMRCATIKARCKKNNCRC